MPYRYYSRPGNPYPHCFDPVRSLADPGRYPRTPHADVYQWCLDRFGAEKPPHVADRRWMELDDMILLHHDDDAFEFRMRWC